MQSPTHNSLLPNIASKFELEQTLKLMKLVSTNQLIAITSIAKIYQKYREKESLCLGMIHLQRIPLQLPLVYVIQMVKNHCLDIEAILLNNQLKAQPFLRLLSFSFSVNFQTIISLIPSPKSTCQATKYTTTLPSSDRSHFPHENISI